MPQLDNANRGGMGGKIDFLLNVTNMSNAQLARALSFDASYISRVRAGKRGLPPDRPFVEPASAFFARNVREDYQRETLARELGIMGGWPDDRKKGASLIAAWLEGHSASPAPSKRSADAGNGKASAQPGIQCEARLFFGNEGRREAALAFLGKAAASGGPRELLLQSDEDTTWMTEDAAFADELSRLLAALAEAGCTFTVIHTVSRDAGEMWEGVGSWLPLYLTAEVRPYYYPRLRDGVRERSLFVARGGCALVSSSVRGMQGDEMSVLLRSADAARALEREFDAYLGLCRPLMETVSPDDAAGLASLAAEFRASGAEAVAVRAEGALLCAWPGSGALVASAISPTAYRITEPRLADAIASYIEGLQNSVEGASEVDALLNSLTASR